MAEINRRDFVVTSSAATAGLLLARDMRGEEPQAPRIDALCYGTISSSAIQNAIDGGLTAVVFDIEAYPRQYDTAVRELGNWQVRFDDERLLLVRAADDIARAQREKKLGIILASQDASILGSSLGNWKPALRLFHALGLRVLQLTHNNRTHWGDSFMEKRDGGLSRAGEELVKAMNDAGMLVDLSHCSPHTLFDTVQVSTKPVAVTHAGCRKIAPTLRNKSDEEIRAIGRNGGFFGVFNMTTWLTSRDTASIADVVAHIDHAVQLIGASHVGFGSDGSLDRHDAAAETERMARVQQYGSNPGGPSFEWPVKHVRVPELNAPDRLTRLAEALAKKGYSTADVNGICGGNFARVFGEAGRLVPHPAHSTSSSFTFSAASCCAKWPMRGRRSMRTLDTHWPMSSRAPGRKTGSFSPQMIRVGTSMRLAILRISPRDFRMAR